MSEFCFRFGDHKSSCCDGRAPGQSCDSDADCLGLSSCKEDGRCGGRSFCESGCIQRTESGVVNCCVVESGDCAVDSDCNGRRRCDRGRCAGDSACELRSERDRAAFEDACVPRSPNPTKVSGHGWRHNHFCSFTNGRFETVEGAGRTVVYDRGCACDGVSVCSASNQTSCKKGCWSWVDSTGVLHCTRSA